MHTPLFSSSCVDREKLISVVHALSLDATAAWSGRRWCLGRLNHKRLCLWGPCTGIGFKHLYPRFVCCSKFEWSTWHSCVWRKRVGAWAGATAQPQCSTGRCSLEWRPRGCVAVGRSQLVARGQRGNMLLIELKLKHIDVHRPAPSDMLMNLLPSSSFWSYMGDSYLFVVLSYCIYGSK